MSGQGLHPVERCPGAPEPVAPVPAPADARSTSSSGPKLAHPRAAHRSTTAARGHLRLLLKSWRRYKELCYDSIEYQKVFSRQKWNEREGKKRWISLYYRRKSVVFKLLVNAGKVYGRRFPASLRPGLPKNPMPRPWLSRTFGGRLIGKSGRDDTH